MPVGAEDRIAVILEMAKEAKSIAASMNLRLTIDESKVAEIRRPNGLIDHRQSGAVGEPAPAEAAVGSEP